jgi:large subunit ribosomal protein L28
MYPQAFALFPPKIRRFCDVWIGSSVHAFIRRSLTPQPPFPYTSPSSDKPNAGPHGGALNFEDLAMSFRCDLTGKKAQVGHKVSHSNIKTKRRFFPNLRSVTLTSDALGRSVRARVSANALRTIDHRGGLDAFLLKAKDDQLAPKLLDMKRAIAKKQKSA